MYCRNERVRFMLLTCFLLMSLVWCGCGGCGQGEDDEEGGPTIPGGVVTGRVMTVDGTPLVGAKVEIVKAVRGARPQGVTVNEAGMYRFREVPPGHYALLVTAPEGKNYQPFASKPFAVESGGEVLQDFGLEPGAILKGTLTDADGYPVPGVTVMSQPSDEDPSRVPGQALACVSNGSGEYRLVGLKPGKVAVLVLVPPGEGLANERVRELDLELEGVTAKDFVLLPGGEVFGAVKDPDGEPVKGAEVRARYAFSRTDEEGFYRLTNVKTGENLLNILPSKGSGLAPKTVSEIEVTLVESVEQNVTLDRLGVIEGVVQDIYGEVLGDVPILLTELVLVGEDGREYWGPDVAGSTDEEGKFTIYGVPEGKYQLKVVSASDVDLVNYYELIPVSPNARIARTISLPSGARIAGFVLDENGEPVTGATLLVNRRFRGIEKQTQSGDDGAFEIRGLAEGEGLLTVRPPRGSRLAVYLERVMFHGRESASKTVRMVIGGGVEGKVTDAHGEPLVKVLVTASSGGDAFEAVNTDAEGYYLISNLVPDEYDLRVVPDGGSAESASVAKVTIKAGETVFQRFRLPLAEPDTEAENQDSGS